METCQSCGHPRRLKAASAPSPASGTEDEAVAVTGTQPQSCPGCSRSWRRQPDVRGGAGSRCLRLSLRAALQRSSWSRPRVPALFLFRHWLLSLAGAEPGLAGRFDHRLLDLRGPEKESVRASGKANFLVTLASPSPSHVQRGSSFLPNSLLHRSGEVEGAGR